MLVECPQLVLQSHAATCHIYLALHDFLEGTSKGRTAVSSCVEDPVRVCLLKFSDKTMLPGTALRLQVFEIVKHRCDCVCKHVLDLLLHEHGKALEADGAQELWPQLLFPHPFRITLVACLPQHCEILGTWRSIRPMRQSQCEANEFTWQVTKAINPVVHILRRQIREVLVQLSTDEDGPAEVSVQLPALGQCGHCCSITALFNAEHDIPRIPHE
mmetsp:Transcript_3652/g.6444  ORF Transcript_3652/g.6444 Transcript_3652/m.6444 type:complete len:215 (+) Transcript_3652:1229-1873(+)